MRNNMNNFAVTVAWVLAALLLGPTILGLVQNSLLRENALFVATTAHNHSPNIQPGQEKYYRKLLLSWLNIGRVGVIRAK